MTTAQDERERLECMVGAWRTDGRYWSESLNLKSNIHSNDACCSDDVLEVHEFPKQQPVKRDKVACQGKCNLAKCKEPTMATLSTPKLVIARTSADDGRLSNQFNWHSEIKRIQGSATFYLLDKHGIFLPSRNYTKNSNYRACVGRRSVLLTLRPNKLILPLPSLGAYKDIIRPGDRSPSSRLGS